MCLLCTAVRPQPVITVAGSGSVHVPLEDVLQLAQGLMAYLQQHNPVAEPSSPPRKQQARGQQLAPANAGVVPTPVQLHAIMYVCMYVCMPAEEVGIQKYFTPHLAQLWLHMTWECHLVI